MQPAEAAPVRPQRHAEHCEQGHAAPLPDAASQHEHAVGAGRRLHENDGSDESYHNEGSMGHLRSRCR